MIFNLEHDGLPTDAGEKARRLQILMQSGFLVPPTCVVTSPLSCNSSNVDAAVAKLAQSSTYAVRSCYEVEDGPHSFAGVFESCLHVHADDVVSAMQNVVASVTADRAVAYAAQHHIVLAPEKMNVLIQPMVTAKEYGVCFTVSPLDETKLLIVTAAQPDGVTAGVDHIHERIIERSQITDTSPPTIELTCMKIEALFGHPQDVEFAATEEAIYILQTCPVA